MKKKVLIVIHSLKRGGGAERAISNLTTQLSKKYYIFILTIHDFKNLYPFKGNYYSLRENIGLRGKILSSFKFYTFIRPFRIYKIIKKISPDIILSNMDLTNIYSILSKILFRFKIPLIVVTHTNPKIAYKERKSYLNLLLKLFYSLKLVDKIITISKDVQSIFYEKYGISKSKLETIYNGINIAKIKEMKKEIYLEFEKIFNDDDILKFITMGRLIESKGHIYLIEAFSILKKVVPNSKLIFIGDGPLKNELELLILNKNLNKDVIFLGYKENPFKYLEKSNIFVFSSLYEGLPMVLIEAMACGLPIISTNCETGPSEILDNGRYGFLVNVKDSEDLAEKMIILARNKKLIKNYKEISLKRADFFNIERIKSYWINLFESF